jgi:hypothetical protein
MTMDAARIREVGRIIYDEWNKSRGPGVAELCILWAEKTAAKILDAQGAAPEGHDEPCAFCGKPCSSLAGDPSQWPLGFAHPDGTGVCKWHHVGCVVERLFPAQGAAPAGWQPEGVDGLVQRDPAPCAARSAPTSGWRTMQTGGAPSPAGASAEPPIRPNDDPPEQVRAREEAERRHPHPLSEWRDEELFRAAPFSSESPRWEETDAGRILRSRGWRPWHGSDKAPVEGPVEVRRLDGGTGTYSYTGPVLWKHFKRSDDIIAYRPVPAKAERPYEAEPTARFCWNCGTFQTDPRCNVCGVGVDERTEPAAADPTPAADAGEVERLWSLAQGIEKSLETCGHVTLDNAEWTMVCTALRVAALRPAPTEEQVEWAAWRVGSHYGIHIYEGETPIATALTPEFARQIVDEHNYGARAILAIGPALQAGEGR